MLSALPKLADKDFVVGFLLPTLLAAFAVAWSFPEVAALEPLRSSAVTDKQLSELVYVVLSIWTAAVLLMAANYVLYRVLEGYLPPFSLLAPLRGWQRRRFRKLWSRHDTLMAEWSDAQRDVRPFLQVKREEVERLRRNLLERYPATEAQVMPTAFGNVLLAFELYSMNVYGADAIPVWPRLASVIPKNYAAQVSGARAQVDCFVNIAFLASAVVLAAVARAVAHAIDPATNGTAAEVAGGPDAVRWMIAAVAGLAVSLLSYRWAVASAAYWGEVVKSAFDCYLPALIRRLGYTVPPTEAERRAFWEQFSARMLYQYPIPREWPVAGQSDRDVVPERLADANAEDDAVRGGEGAEESNPGHRARATLSAERTRILATGS